MKRYFLLFFFVSFIHSISAQFELGWQKEISSTNNCDIVSFQLLGDLLLYTQKDFGFDGEVMSNKLYARNALTGDLLWSHDWEEDFPLYVNVELFQAKDNLLYYFVHDSHANKIDHYGVIDGLGNFMWQDSTNINSLLKVTSSEGFLYIDNSTHNDINRLMKVDTEGNRLWVIEDGLHDAWNNLVSSNEGSLYWLNQNGLTKVDSEGNIVGRDDGTEYYRYWSTFHAHKDISYSLTWQTFKFTATKYTNDFPSNTKRDIPFSYDIFDTPNPSIYVDQESSVYFSSDWDYDGKSFLTKFDDQFNNIWTIESTEGIVNLFEDNQSIIAVNASAIVEIDKDSGSIKESSNYINSENVLDRKAKHQKFQSDRKELYLFTVSENRCYINQYQKKIVDNLDESQLIQKSVYPNPVSDVLYIDKPEMNQRIELFNVHGQYIKSVHPDQQSIKTHDLAKGIYFLHFSSDEERKIIKFIKN